MFLWHLIRTSPGNALVLITSIVTLFWCLQALRRQHSKTERYLMGVVGLFATYQGLHVLQTAGFWELSPNMQGIGTAANLTFAGLCFAATLVIQLAAADRQSTSIRLRMAEAAEHAPRIPRPVQPPRERTALAVFGVDAAGEVNLWHNSSEEFFGWKREEVLGTRHPFMEPGAASSNAIRNESGLPHIVALRTMRNEELEALAWFMPIPGESGCLVLVLDYRKVRRPEVSRASLAAATLVAREARATT